MKIVIDIPEEEYMLIKQKMELNIGGVPSESEQAIINGTPLDKIRTEIEHVIDNTYDSTDHDKSLYNGAYKDGLYDALDIIDKYKAESEGSNADSN